MPAISIIIPIYNVEKYLKRCLESVQNQTFADWEAICVNDGSPDNCHQILTEFAAKDARFKIVNKENGGLSDARNAGMQVATGEYILYLDSDDFIHPQTMEIAYAMAKRDKSDIVSFTYDRIYRPQLMVRHILKMDTDGVVPIRIKKRYQLDKIKTRVTDDIYQYATEEDTINAYNYYDSLSCVDYVEVDSIVTPTNVQNEKINPSGVEDDFSYTSWGANSMGVEDYSNYLLDSIGSTNLPELVVAVLDTGLDSDHSWFLNRIANGGANYSPSISKTSYEW